MTGGNYERGLNGCVLCGHRVALDCTSGLCRRCDALACAFCGEVAIEAREHRAACPRYVDALMLYACNGPHTGGAL